MNEAWTLSMYTRRKDVLFGNCINHLHLLSLDNSSLSCSTQRGQPLSHLKNFHKHIQCGVRWACAGWLGAVTERRLFYAFICRLHAAHLLRSLIDYIITNDSHYRSGHSEMGNRRLIRREIRTSILSDGAKVKYLMTPFHPFRGEVSFFVDPNLCRLGLVPRCSNSCSQILKPCWFQKSCALKS